MGIRGSSFFGLVKFVPRLAAAFSMAVWFGIVLPQTNLAVASPVLVVAILEHSGGRLGSVFGDCYVVSRITSTILVEVRFV